NFTDDPESQKQCFLRAIALGHAELITAMIDKGFNVNQVLQQESGNTALHYACMQNKLDIVEILLEHNADNSIKNKNGKIPPELLPPEPPKPYVLTDQRKEELVDAIIRGNIPLVTNMLDQGFPINETIGTVNGFVKSQEKMTALHLAHASANQTMIHLLIARGAD